MRDASGLGRKLTGRQGLRDLGRVYRTSNHKRIVSDVRWLLSIK